jgi:GGDEF domain-containing protein
LLRGNGAGLRVHGAELVGARLEIRWDDAARTWRARARGPVQIDGEVVAEKALAGTHDLRVADTFFRFLSGQLSRDLERLYHETIYHLTILDLPTGLPNLRYLRELLGNELRRAAKLYQSCPVAVLRVEALADFESVASHDLLVDLCERLRPDLPAHWTLGRYSEYEIAVIAPGATTTELEQWLSIRCCRTESPARVQVRYGVDSAASTPEALLEAARAAVELP